MLGMLSASARAGASRPLQRAVVILVSRRPKATASSTGVRRSPVPLPGSQLALKSRVGLAPWHRAKQAGGGMRNLTPPSPSTPPAHARWEACAGAAGWDAMSTDEKAAWSALGWCEDTWPRRDFSNPRLPPSKKRWGVGSGSVSRTHAQDAGHAEAARTRMAVGAKHDGLVPTPHTRLGQFWVEAATLPRGAQLEDAPPVFSSLLLDKLGLQERPEKPGAVVELSHKELDEALGARLRSGLTFGEAVTWDCHVLVGDRRFAPFDPRGWENMPAEQKRQAEWLGYTQQTWSAPYLYHSHNTLTWEQLDVDARRHWTVLGWTRVMWDDSDETPAPCNKDWADLTPIERASAQALGYAARSWDWDETNSSSWPEKLFWKFFCYFGAAGTVGTVLLLSALGKDSNGTSGEDQAGASRLWRVTRNARQDWKEQCEARGFRFHSAPALTTTGNKRDPYWNESAAYVLTDELQGEIESTQILKTAMWELHNMCLAAVDKVVKDDALLDAFEIPLPLRDAVKQSWQHKQPDLIGRFDLLVSGSEPPKLLEYNADTPTLMVEAGLVQADWAAHLGVKQFNRIDKLLVASWPRMLKRAAAAWGRSVESLQPVLFAAHRTSLEEADNIDYLAATARRGGLAVTLCDIDHVKIPDSSLAPVVEAPGTKSPARVKAIWKLYPYEWLAEEELGEALQGSTYAHNAANPSGCLWMEPPWKLVLSSKALLPMLWQMFPGHPNLLPAFWTAQEASWHEAQVRTNEHYEDEYGWVAKPKYGREGVGILYSFDFPNMDAFDDQVHAMLEAFDATRHHYDPEAVKKVQQNAQAARLLAAARQSNFTSCNVETQAVMRQSQDDDSREGWARSHGAQAMNHDVPFPPLGGAIFQEYYDTPTYCGRQCVVGGFMVFGEPAGLTFREDNIKTTNDFSCFVPHMLEDTLKEPRAVTVDYGVTRGVDDITGQYVRHGFYNGRPSYKHDTLGDVYLLFDGTAWTFSPTEQATSQILGKFAVQDAKAPGFNTANSLGSFTQCEMYNSASDSFTVVGLRVKPQVTVAKVPPQRNISSHELALRKALYGEPVPSKRRRTRRNYYYGWPLNNSSYLVKERPNYQQASAGGAGAGAGAGGTGRAGAVGGAPTHHARHTSNANLRPAQQYTGPRRKTGSYARYSGAHSGGGSGGS